MNHPTSYPGVNASLDELLSGAQTTLGDRFVGLYLYGSLASGDFNPETSDVDFLVVTDGELPEDVIAALEAMHMRLIAGSSKWAAKLEGSYFPLETLRRYNPDDPPRPATNEGRFYVGHQESDWIIQRHVLREQGVVVAGPPIKPLIDPVSPDDIRQAVVWLLRERWRLLLERPRLRDEGYPPFAVLTMCRALYTLQQGTLASKPAAARWAQETLGEPWAALVGEALAWRPGMPFDQFDETVAFIRYVIEQSGGDTVET